MWGQARQTETSCEDRKNWLFNGKILEMLEILVSRRLSICNFFLNVSYS